MSVPVLVSLFFDRQDGNFSPVAGSISPKIDSLLLGNHQFPILHPQAVDPVWQF